MLSNETIIERYDLGVFKVIILAAGNSSRLGEPKQLLKYNGKTLLDNAIDQALLLQPADTLVVTGADKEDIEWSIKGKPVTIVYNEDWEEGIASSIRAGVIAVKQGSPDVPACIIMVCDQPFVTDGLLQQLVDIYQQTGKKIVSATCSDQPGTPALFDKSFFDELMQLQGESGVEKLLLLHDYHLARVPFSRGNIDINTKEDFDRLKTGAL